MPPRYAYWTILIDDKPTAFRAREREELQPTFVQLQRKNTNVTMQWFARGKLWASREAERDDFQTQKHAAAAPRPRSADRPADRPEGGERRGSDWRPGGAHTDPRDRFKKKNRPERAWSEKDPATQRDRDKPGYVAPAAREPRGDRPWQDKPRGDRPWSNKPSGSAPRGDRPWSGKPRERSDGARGVSPAKPRERKPWSDKPAGAAPPSDRPWQTKPTGPRAQRKPWIGKPAGDAPRGDRPWRDRPAGGPPRGDRPWSNKPPTSAPRGDRPWQDKPRGKPQGDRPWSSKPAAGGGTKRPWSGKPRDLDRKPFTPRGPRAGGAPAAGAPRKRRDDDPDKG